MFRLTIKELAAKKLRLFSTALAVFLGVAFLAGTLVLTDTVMSTFDDILEDAHAGTDAYVRGASPLDLSFGEQRPRIDDALVDTINNIDGVASSAVNITGYAQVVGDDGEPVSETSGAPVLGLNWVDVPELNPYEVDQGREPIADDEIVIDKHTASLGDFVPGDSATVLTRGEPQTFTIVGLARFGDADSYGGASSVFFTDDTAQALLSEPGEVDGIAVVADGDVAQADLVARISTVAPGDAEIITGAALTQEDQDAIHEMISSFGIFMLVFAGVAMFVGAFIINNTFSITVAQRTREMAMLRAIGASGRQVKRAVLAEAAAVGTVAAVGGLVAGIGVAALLKMLLASAGLDIPDGAPIVQTSTVVVSLIVGILVTLLSAVTPARRAAKVPPISAMRDTAIERSGASRRRAIVATTILATGVAALLVGLSEAAPALVGLGAVTVFIGVSALGPVLARPVAYALGAPMARFRGMAGSLARQNAVRNPKRTAKTSASLMIGVALVSFIAVFAASAKSSMAGSLDRDYSGTTVIDSGAFDSTSGISPELAAELRSTPGVTTVSEYRLTRAEVDGESRSMFAAFDATTIGSLFDLGHVEGDLTSLGADGIAMYLDPDDSTPPKLGDIVEVTFPNGQRPMTVRATFDNARDWIGTEFVDVQAFADGLDAQLDARIYVSASDVAAVEQVADSYATAKVLDKDGFIEERYAEIDTMLKLMYAMLGLAVVIALLGIANTLALSIHERRRELGLLRAVGMSRSQVRTTVRYESVIIALFGTGLGLCVGIFFGWAMVGALKDEGVDTLSVPVNALIVVTVGGAVAGVLAAVSPARRAANVDVLKAVASS
jgi:putative ABC transport system permease protein